MKEDSLKNEGGQLKFNADGTISLPANIEREVKRKTYNFVDEKELDIWDDKGYDDETYHLNDDVSKFNLYDSGERMKALMFSNGLSQGEVVDKVVNLIDEGKKVIFIRGVCGSGKCLSRDTEVFAKPNGKSLFGSYKIFDLVGKTGKILSLDEKGKLIETSFCNVRKTGIKKLFKLKTRTGRMILASKNHPFLTITEKGIEWVPLEKLGKSSYVCVPNKIDLKNEIDHDDDEIKVLAHLIAEGKLGDKVGSPVYFQDSNLNLGIRKDYEISLKNLFPEGKIKSYCGKDVVITFNNFDTRFGTTNKLRLLIRKYGLDGKKSSEKFVPKFIFNLRKEKISLFLSRLFSCDGCIYVVKNDQIRIEYCSISRQLIKDVSALLLRFGIQHTITSKKFRDDPNYSWRISISNTDNLKKYISEIGFIGRKQIMAKNLYPKIKDCKHTNIDKVPRVIRKYLNSLNYSYLQLDRFLNYDKVSKERLTRNFREIRKDKTIETPFVFKQSKIDFLRTHIDKVNSYIDDDVLSFICSEDIFWDKVNEIETLNEEEVYDLEVPNHHNFIADGIIVHNSAMALNIARALGNASVVVPGKALQKQYQEDYSQSKYVLRKNHKKLKIKVITGRDNHRCLFKSGVSANDSELPCKIEIKEKNMFKIREYVKDNPKVRNDLELGNVRRMSIAPVCPHWGPIVPAMADLNLDAKKVPYVGGNNISYEIYNRKPGCSYYEQFNAYKEAEVVVFNSAKYKLEFLMGRKPDTKVEIIDECDEFLDSFSNSKMINLLRLRAALLNFFPDDERIISAVRNLQELISDLLVNDGDENIFELKNTRVEELFRIFLDNHGIIEEVDEDSYVHSVYETVLEFKDFMGESFGRFRKEERGLVIDVVSVNLARRFEELRDKNHALVLMSGTIHNENALRDVFGIDDFEIVDAEIINQGEIIVRELGVERDCSYRSLQNGGVTREYYLKAFNRIVEESVKPVLIHVNAFADLPSEDEKYSLGLDSLMTRDRLKDLQKNGNEQVSRFKKGEMPVLFTTRCNRGVDFPGDQCRSIIFTKYPNPAAQGLFWQILRKVHPEYYWGFYKDKASREFLQKIYRGVRSKADHVNLYSPDSRVLDAGRSLGF